MTQSSHFLRAAIAFAFLLRVATADPLQHLNEPCNPYYVGLESPKLTTPQWYGEADVDAVVILSIDDMRDPATYESYLRPILDRLKKIDGHAPVSIFTNEIKPDDPRLQTFLKEGISLECHTIDHPCPLLKDNDFAKAKSTYDRCIDMLTKVPNMQPVAFRMPCCDSLNTPSPRFWTEIFDKTTDNGNFLTIDSSVFNITTADDPDLPKEITTNERGESRFRHYVPFPSFVNTIENYPYPYVIGDTCWEFPCTVPSDWEAQHVQQPNNPDTVRDMKILLDAAVIKQGTMSLVFHPHGWIRAEQIVQLIDHAQEKHGKRVKFITFADAAAKLKNHLLNGHSLRDANGPTGVRMADVDGDGYLDVTIPLEGDRLMTRIWNESQKKWLTRTDDIPGKQIAFGRFGKRAAMVVGDKTRKKPRTYLYFKERGWDEQIFWLNESIPDSQLNLFDINNDRKSELFVSNNGTTTIYHYEACTWRESEFGLPDGVHLQTQRGGDAGLRFRDINGDNQLDIFFANGRDYAIHLFDSTETGWKPAVRSGKSGDAGAIPSIVRGDGTNNGGWFHSDHFWVQNEQTDRLPDKVDRVPFAQLLDSTAGQLAASSTSSADEYPPAKSTEDALAAFARRDGMRIELVASEPQIVDPVAFDWAADGSFYVVEMRDYPNGISWRKQGDKMGEPGGRVKRLTDTDGDGKFETASIFLDNLPFPNGVKTWRDGILITAAPHVIYAEDTTGDGVADKQQTLYVGFNEGNQQHRVNGLRWGLDGWLHLANGDSGGKIRSAKTGDEVNMSGRDLRIAPGEGWIETQSGQTQSGRSRDDSGNWFGGNNSSPVWHYVLDEQRLKRNPHYAPPSVRHEIAAIPGAAPIFPISKTVTRFNDFDRANRYTSACSPEIFRESCHLEKDPRRIIYVCEPVHNLIGREVITDDGLTFRSQRAEEEQDRELITSSDNWCRPVMARTGPDGALWIADMYRLVIEHPEWVPKEWQDRLDLRGGEDKGRIYRVVFNDVEDKFNCVSWKKLKDAGTDDLIGSLDSSNGTLRDMIQQQLVWQNDAAAANGLRRLLVKATWPATRIHALHTLNSLGALTDEDLVHAMAQPNATARHAVMIATQKQPGKNLFARPGGVSTACADALLKLSKQKVPRTNGEGLRCLQQVAYAIGDIDDDRAGDALATILLNHTDEPFMVAAVMSSLNQKNLGDTLKRLAASTDCPNSILSTMLATAVSFDCWDTIEEALINLPVGRGIGWAEGLIKAMRRRNDSGDMLQQKGRSALLALVTTAHKQAQNETLSPPQRIQAIGLFGCPQEKDKDRRFGIHLPKPVEEIEILLGLLSPQTANDVQLAAVEQLGAFEHDDVAKKLIAKWSTLTPRLRQKSLDLLLSRDAWTQTVIDAIRSGQLPPQEISTRHRQRMLSSNLMDEKTANLVGGSAKTNRGEVVASYASVAELEGDVDAGKKHFTKACGTCHQLANVGYAIGPDLSALTDKSVPAMLTAILDPNAAVEDKYLSYSVLTEDGRQFSGLLAAETATSITLQQADGKQQQILRRDIEELVATGKSHMPEGLEQELPPQAIADVIAFVQSITAPPRRFAGNQPQVAPIRDDGSIRLFAMHARIYGTAVEFEQQYRNLGMWSDANDRAIWELNVPKAGQYQAVLDFACDSACTGNRIQLVANGKKVIAEVRPTGSWNDYTTRSIGTLTLPEGKTEVTLKADGAINKFLGDFRTIILEPK